MLKLAGFVASTQEFFDQAAVADATSELHRCARKGRRAYPVSAGIAALPGNSAVEVELIIRTMGTV